MSGGNRNLNITLGMNTRPARQEAQSYQQFQKKLAGELLASEISTRKQINDKLKALNREDKDARIKAAKDFYAAEEKIRKDAEARNREALKKQAEGERITRKQIEEAELKSRTVLARYKIHLAKKADAEMLASAKATAAQQEAIARQEFERQEALDKKAAAREDRMARVRVRTKIAAIKKADAAMLEATQKEIEHQEKLNTVIKAGALAMGTFGAALAGSLLAHWDKVRQDAFSAAEDVMRMRDAVRELQALRGELGKTSEGVSHVHEMAASTLQRPEEVMAMEEAGLGVGELALKNQKDKDEFQKAMIAAGRFQAMEGGDSGAYGQMMGQLALSGKVDAREMEARAYRLYQIQQPGGFRTMSQAMGQYSKLNGLVQNGVYTPEEAMGLASAFSVSSPEESATRTQQFTRSVMAARIKARGMKVSDDVDFENTSEYFKGLGITEKDSAIERGKKIAKDLAAQRAKNKNFNAHEYLMSHGFGNQEDREAIMEFSGLLNSGNLEKIEKAQNAQLQYGSKGTGVIKETFEDRLKNDPRLKNVALENAEKAINTKEGLEEEPLVQAQQAAFNRLKAQGKIQGYKTFSEWRNAGFLERGWADLRGGQHHQVNAEASRILSEQRKQLGLPQLSGFQWSEHEEMKRSAQEVKAAGGDVTGGYYQKEMPGVIQGMKEAAKDLKEAAKEMRGGKGKTPAPMGGKPQPIPTRSP